MHRGTSSSVDKEDIFRHALISAERSFVMKDKGEKEANIPVKDGVDIQIPDEWVSVKRYWKE